MSRIRLAAVIAAALACGGKEQPATAAFATGTVCPQNGTALRWADFQLAFFGKADGSTGYCNYCHDSTRLTLGERNGAPAHATFDKLDVVRAHAVLIDALAGKGPVPTTPTMPYLFPPPLPAGVPNPQPVPSDVERENLSLWLACGAP